MVGCTHPPGVRAESGVEGDRMVGEREGGSGDKYCSMYLK